MRDHFDLLKSLGCEVMVVAEVTGCVHGDQKARLSARPTMPPERWTEYGRRLTALAELIAGGWATSPITITWARWSSRAPTSTPS